MADRPDKAIQWHERIAAEAQFEFQRFDAIAEQARIHAQAGRLDRSSELYRQLLDAEETAGPDQASLWAIRLGEVEALRSSGGAFSTVPAATYTDAGVEPAPEGDSSGD